MMINQNISSVSPQFSDKAVGILGESYPVGRILACFPVVFARVQFCQGQGPPKKWPAILKVFKSISISMNNNSVIPKNAVVYNH